MSDIVTPLLQWLNANPQWAGLATFIISAAESVAIVGTIVPGSVTMTAIGALAGAGVIPFWATIFWAMLGAIVGDGISYWIGHYFKDRLRRTWPFKNNPGILEKGEAFVHKYGVMSVFIGRFVGPVRALVPLVAGMLGMKPLQFTVANVTSAIGWAPAYMLPGMLLGAASLELPPDIAMHVILVLMMIILFIVLCVWIAVKVLLLINKQTEQWLVHMWNALKRSRYFHGATVLLKHHDETQHHGQLTLAFYFLVTCLVLLSLIIYVKWVGASHIAINDALFHLFRGIRSPETDNTMIGMTLLGQKEVILPVLLAFAIWLILIKRTRMALHAVALGVLAAGSVYVIKHLVQSPRPWGILYNHESFSFPSGHTVLATTLYIGIAFFMAAPMKPNYRWLLYFPAVFLAFVVGVSRLYLGAHWFTDVLAAWLLSAAILMLISLSFHRQHENRISLIKTSLLCVPTFMLCYAFFYMHAMPQLKHDYAQLSWPTVEISLKEWWEKDEAIPASRVSLFGLPSQRINIQWAGDLNQIKATLLKEGWSTPPARDWISILHRMADIQSTEYLPLVSQQYLDKKPVLILARRTNGKNKLIVLRLWESNRILDQTQSPLWVGTIGMVPRSYGWLFQKRNHVLDVHPHLIFPHQSAIKQWQFKILTLPPTTVTKKNGYQKILLIREK